MPGSIHAGEFAAGTGISPNVTMREARAFSDGVERANKIGSAAAVIEGHPLGAADPTANAAFIRGAEQAAVGASVGLHETAYRGISSAP